MGNNIVYNKHPSDFEDGSIIKIINSSFNFNNSLWLVLNDNDKIFFDGDKVFAVLLGNYWGDLGGRYFISKGNYDFEIMRGKLKDEI